jgi:signal transduction histidine kinase
MAFKVAARTILELGAELISSDAVAIYELVKNAIDARSKDGVTIEFSIILSHGDYTDALIRALELVRRENTGDAVAEELNDLKAFVRERMVPAAPRTATDAFNRALDETGSAAMLTQRLRDAYVENNWIEFRDTGHGMSRDDLLNAYLLLGTPSRRRDVDDAVLAHKPAPYLGEKGIGRLSAMRLGSRLRIETATATDTRWNLLEIDWTDFDDLDKLLSDVPVDPTTGPKKPSAGVTGTIIRISDLNAGWSPGRLRKAVTFELARLTNPLSPTKRRFRIVVIFNGERIDVPRLDRSILDLSHARATGTYTVHDGHASLEAHLWCGDLGKGNAPEERRIHLEQIDLRAVTKDAENEIPASALRTVGPFSFEVYWFNRRILRGIDSIGDRRRVMELQRQWSGIMLFRDGYRVFPYGEEGDDWLKLDRQALSSGGYKLNKTQFIGAVTISRTANPELIDQTSREGLKDCPEKSVLIEVVGYAIQERLRLFLDEIEARQKHVELDLDQAETRVEDLEKRARRSINELEKRHSNERPQLRELLTMFDEMRHGFDRAKARAEEVEDERDRMLQLAGIGLMLEVIAHELARSTEYTLRMLDESKAEHLPVEVASLFRALREEMKTMNKRLRVLDPLSVSGRQRKETFGLAELVRDILDGHTAQFRRHHIHATVDVASGLTDVRVHGVRGMFVQIVENFIQNSIYWFDLRRRDEDDFKPAITITIGPSPVVLEYTDNGPGIQPSLRDEVFKPFFSTKGKTRRQGLGLFIARDCATYHGGQLYLSDARTIHAGRLNTFVLELPTNAAAQ